MLYAYTKSEVRNTTTTSSSTTRHTNKKKFKNIKSLNKNTKSSSLLMTRSKKLKCISNKLLKKSGTNQIETQTAAVVPTRTSTRSLSLNKKYSIYTTTTNPTNTATSVLGNQIKTKSRSNTAVTAASCSSKLKSNTRRSRKLDKSIDLNSSKSRNSSCNSSTMMNNNNNTSSSSSSYASPVQMKSAKNKRQASKRTPKSNIVSASLLDNEVKNYAAVHKNSKKIPPKKDTNNLLNGKNINKKNKNLLSNKILNSSVSSFNESSFNLLTDLNNTGTKDLKLIDTSLSNETKNQIDNDADNPFATKLSRYNRENISSLHENNTNNSNNLGTDSKENDLSLKLLAKKLRKPKKLKKNSIMSILNNQENSIFNNNSSTFNNTIFDENKTPQKNDDLKLNNNTLNSSSNSDDQNETNDNRKKEVFMVRESSDGEPAIKIRKKRTKKIRDQLELDQMKPPKEKMKRGRKPKCLRLNNSLQNTVASVNNPENISTSSTAEAILNSNLKGQLKLTETVQTCLQLQNLVLPIQQTTAVSTSVDAQPIILPTSLINEKPKILHLSSMIKQTPIATIHASTLLSTSSNPSKPVLKTFISRPTPSHVIHTHTSSNQTLVKNNLNLLQTKPPVVTLRQINNPVSNMANNNRPSAPIFLNKMPHSAFHATQINQQPINLFPIQTAHPLNIGSNAITSSPIQIFQPNNQQQPKVILKTTYADASPLKQTIGHATSLVSLGNINAVNTSNHTSSSSSPIIVLNPAGQLTHSSSDTNLIHHIHPQSIQMIQNNNFNNNINNINNNSHNSASPLNSKSSIDLVLNNLEQQTKLVNQFLNSSQSLN
jgi:hypothetical protein